MYYNYFKKNKYLEENNFNKIFKLCNLQIIKLKDNLDDVDVCAICLSQNINCKTECGHKFCTECYIINTLVYKINKCAYCRRELSNMLLIY
jgi:hypothetical protein